MGMIGGRGMRTSLARSGPVEMMVRLFYILDWRLNMLIFSIEIPRTVRGGKQYEFARHLPRFALSSSPW
jgi:hypothetical protein